MKRVGSRPYPWILYLAAGFLYGGVVLRSLLLYTDPATLGPVLGLLAAYMVLFAGETWLSGRWPALFPIYLLLQTLLVFGLLSLPGFPDYCAVLFAILSMQMMQRLAPRLGAAWMALLAPLMALALANAYGVARAVASALIYTFLNVFLGFYALTTRLAEEARARNQALAQQLQQTNCQLEEYASQLERLAVARERQRLARELHDSVTQTVFSMTLTTQSALLLVDRDASRVRSQLDRLSQLERSALAEMQVLISELLAEYALPGLSAVRSRQTAGNELALALRRHLAERPLPEDLAISLETEGDGRLEPAEEQSLFRIAQEALNNIVKHAHAPHACIRLHLVVPFWMEIADQGQGFDLKQARNSGRVGLASMVERAAEIGWELRITTAPGAGTCIRVEKSQADGRPL